MIDLYPPLDLARARVLIANDDGVHAPGIKVLEKVLAPLVKDVWVVAPEAEQSAASHSLTMRRPLYLHQVGRQHFAVNGTPTDCVLLAIHHLMKESPPDLVVSGINRGGNLGEDATYSGTVAAAMEGTLLGFPSIAFSQVYGDGGGIRWSTAERWVPEVLACLALVRWPLGVLMNVNFPAVAGRQVTGVEVTRQGRHKIGGGIVEGRDPRGNAYFWIGGDRAMDRGRPGTDLEAVSRGAVAVTPLYLDMTHEATVQDMKATLS